ncbi:hypothetical protein K5X82_06515 [Halosquirtibacter xylanolyticus]|uniref:toxin-antitoxin system YwqK family antitoxin n=1 Tax=Halosquirtibacter xylanolyticus TaxID=3374599 RepID=UPI00374A1D83|nr:hypothetical protein K5X82_06515 [Prolixibacteraceae bacterium]
MKHIFAVIILSLLTFSLSARDHRVKKQRNKAVEKENRSLPRLHVLDYNLNEINRDAPLFLIHQGLYLNLDSTKLNAVVYIYLTKLEEKNRVYGWISGKIKDGKRDGAWTKEVYTIKRKHVVVQKLNYRNGLLDGDYFVYNLQGEILRASYGGDLPSSIRFIQKGQLISENKYYDRKLGQKTGAFVQGTGFYLDYYYDTGKLKERGAFKDGSKTGQWYVFDPTGKVLRIDTYHNGFRLLN